MCFACGVSAARNFVVKDHFVEVVEVFGHGRTWQEIRQKTEKTLCMNLINTAAKWRCDIWREKLTSINVFNWKRRPNHRREKPLIRSVTCSKSWAHNICITCFPISM
jgi:hypothetical protein